MSTPDQEFKQAIVSRNVNVICIKRFLKIGDGNDGLQQLNSEQIDEIFRRIGEKITPDKWTLIVFSESFFGDTEPSSNEHIDYIMEKCKQLTENFTKIVVHISFLHKFCIDKTPIWLQQYAPIPMKEISKRLINTTQHTEFLQVNETNTNRVANYSLVIWNEQPITIYRKSTYCKEAEITVNNKNGATHAYEFGDFKSHILITDEIFKQMAEVFAGKRPIVVTRMCSDMNHRFLNTLPKNRKTMLILAANEAPQFEFIGTTLHVDDYIKCNKYITVHNASKRTTIRVAQEIAEDTDFLGFCFNIEEISDCYIEGYCFSNPNDYPIAVSHEGEDDDDCCGCF